MTYKRVIPDVDKSRSEEKVLIKDEKRKNIIKEAKTKEFRHLP